MENLFVVCQLEMINVNPFQSAEHYSKQFFINNELSFKQIILIWIFKVLNQYVGYDIIL